MKVRSLTALFELVCVQCRGGTRNRSGRHGSGRLRRGRRAGLASLAQAGLYFFISLLVSVQPAVAQTVAGRVEVIEKSGQKRDRVEGVLVYLDGVVAPIPDGLRNRSFTMTSRNKTFDPHVEVVPVGSTVTFPNVDDIMHNVFSLSRGNRFDLGLYKSGAKKNVVFENPGLVRVYCNIHPQMSGFIQVMSSPYFGLVSPEGGFRLEDIPPGSYRLAVWHEEGETSRPIVVTEQGAKDIVIELDVSDFKKRPHLNKFGKPYKRGKY